MSGTYHDTRIQSHAKRRRAERDVLRGVQQLVDPADDDAADQLAPYDRFTLRKHLSQAG